MKWIVLVASVLVPGLATAQERMPFTGIQAGPEVGLHEHRFTLEFTDQFGSTERTYRATGIAAGGFAGYDLAVARRLRLGVELGANVGGGDGPRADVGPGLSYTTRPRYGWTATARAGVVLGDHSLLYGTLGYGEYHYRVRTAVFIDGADDTKRNLIVGGGVEHRLGRRIGIRLDARVLPGGVTRVMAGVPVRF